MAEYDREADIHKVIASNPGMTRAEAEAQIDRNSKLNNSLTGAASGLFSKDKFNLDLGAIVKKINAKSLQNTGDTAIADREATQGSVLGTKINSVAGGFKSLTTSTDEGETVTSQPSLVIMTAAVDGDGLAVTRTSGKITEITTLTGKTASNGFLTTAVTQGSPKGIEKTLTATVGATPEAIKTKMKATSSNGEVAEQNFNVDVSEKVAANVTKVTQKNNDNLANPFGTLSSAFSGSAGNPFANILGNVAGLVAGVLKKGQLNANTINVGSVASKPALVNIDTSQTIVDATQAQRNFLLNKSLTAFASKALGVNLTVPTLPGAVPSIPGGFPGAGLISNVGAKTQLDPNNFKLTTQLPKLEPVEVVKQDGSTNLSKAIDKSTLTSPSVKSTIPSTKLDNSEALKLFNGVDTLPRDYFTYVNSKEELEAEIRTISAKRPITAFVVGATNTPYNIAVFAHDRHRVLTKASSPGQSIFKLLSDSLGTTDTTFLQDYVKKYGGIQSHYFIGRSGSLQRARPLILPVWDGGNKLRNGFNARLISIAFVGGLDLAYPVDKSVNRNLHLSSKNYTTKQWETFEVFCKAFEAAIPGGEGLGVIDIYTDGVPDKPTLGQPYFDVREWTNTRFGWETSYTGNYELNKRIEDKLGVLLPTELNNAIPAKVVKPTITPVVTKPVAPPKKPADPETGEKPKPTFVESKNCEDNMEMWSKQIESKIDEKSGASQRMQKRANASGTRFDAALGKNVFADATTAAAQEEDEILYERLTKEIAELEKKFEECNATLTEETPNKEPVKKFESVSEERTNRNKVRKELFSLSKVGVLSDSGYTSQLASLESQISAKEGELKQAETRLAAAERNQKNENER